MKCPRTGIHSTRKKDQGRKRNTRIATTDIHPNVQQTLPEFEPEPSDETHNANNIFSFAALADKQNGTLYTDATKALPAMSLDGRQYYFIAYDYDTNYIFVIPTFPTYV